VLASGPSTGSKNARDLTVTITNVGKDVGKKEPLFTAGRNVN
jgi:hypothetical protein